LNVKNCPTPDSQDHRHWAKKAHRVDRFDSCLDWRAFGAPSQDGREQLDFVVEALSIRDWLFFFQDASHENLQLMSGLHSWEKFLGRLTTSRVVRTRAGDLSIA
jgi:hypothetical protein